MKQCLLFSLLLALSGLGPVGAAVHTPEPARGGILPAPLPSAAAPVPAGALDLPAAQQKEGRGKAANKSTHRPHKARFRGAAADKPQLDKVSLWSAILGLASFPLMALGGLGLATAIAAIVLGAIGINRVAGSAGSRRGKGYAWFGLISGSVLIVGLLIAVSVFLATWG